MRIDSTMRWAALLAVVLILGGASAVSAQVLPDPLDKDLASDDTQTTAKVIGRGAAINYTANLTLHTTTDLDVSRFSILTDGTRLRIGAVITQAPFPPAASLRLVLWRVPDVDATDFDPNDPVNVTQPAFWDNFDGRQQTFTLDHGTYWIVILESGQNSTVSGYRLTVGLPTVTPDNQDLTPNDDSPDLAKTFSIGQTATYTIHEVDNEDWATFTIAATSTISVTCNVTTPPRPQASRLELTLFGPDNQSQEVDHWVRNPTPPPEFIGFETGTATYSLAPGKYWIRMNSINKEDLIEGYTLSITEAPVAGLEVVDVVLNCQPIRTGPFQTTVNGSVTCRMLGPAGVFQFMPQMVVVGIRDAGGNWVGNEPKVVAAGSVGWDKALVLTQRGFGNLGVPRGVGPYAVWAQMVQTSSGGAAIAAFKAHVAAGPDAVNKVVGDVLLAGGTAGGGQAMPAAPSLSAISARPMPAASSFVAATRDRRIKGLASFQMACEEVPTPAFTVVLGIRDGANNWVGSAPIAMLTDTPPKTFRTYTDRPFQLTAPAASGTYTLRLRMVRTASKAIAVQDFKAATGLWATEVDLGVPNNVIVP